MDGPSSPLASGQIFAHCHEFIARAQAALKEVTRNPCLGAVLGSALSQVEDVLGQLKARPISAGDSMGCSLLHQVKYATVELLHFLEQYETPHFPPAVVFTEVYNAQANRILNRLLALAAACARCLMEFDTLRLRHQSLQRFRPNRNIEDFAAALSSSGTPPVSLPEFLNTSGCDDVHPLVTSAMWGQFQDMDRKLQNADLSHLPGSAYALIHIATLWQNPFAIATLLGLGADVNAPTRANGLFAVSSTPLHLAAALGNASIMKLLLCWGANTKALDSKRNMPSALALNKACSGALSEAVEVQRTTQEACNAAFNGFSHKLFGILARVEVPVNVKFQSSSRYFLIHQVAFNGDLEAYHLLLEAGASPLLRTRDLLLPSAVALNAGRPEIAAKFMQAEEAERAQNADPPRRALPLHMETDREVPAKMEIPAPLSHVRSQTSPGAPKSPTSDVPYSPASPSNLMSPGSRRPPSPLKDAISTLTHKVTDRIRRSSRAGAFLRGVTA
eukprot:GGOE01018499.1.p1 GENE.GGOE01018499.1~~GGOE01018499.1.p1  ORF type:complete len:526 (-),score=148.54 GGOE01018499.1:129-1637(-)